MAEVDSVNLCAVTIKYLHVVAYAVHLSLMFLNFQSKHLFYVITNTALCQLSFSELNSYSILLFLVIYLARSANLPEGLYILLALISYFFLTLAKLSQDLLDVFSRSFAFFTE